MNVWKLIINWNDCGSCKRVIAGLVVVGGGNRKNSIYVDAGSLNLWKLDWPQEVAIWLPPMFTIVFASSHCYIANIVKTCCIMVNYV